MLALRISAILASLVLLGSDCSGGQPPPVKPQPTPIVIDNNYCLKAQENLQRLHCAEGEPTKKGKSFEQFCVGTQQNGVFLNPKCLSEITSCGQVDSCSPTK